MTYLDSSFDRCKSFYNKACYERDKSLIKLYSYNTYVCGYDTKSKSFIEPDYYPHSMTTNRHVREFKKQIEAGYIYWKIQRDTRPSVSV